MATGPFALTFRNKTSPKATNGGSPARFLAKALMVYGRNFRPGFRMASIKNLRNARLAAESLKVSLPLTSLVNSMLISLMNAGKGELDPLSDRSVHRGDVSDRSEAAGTFERNNLTWSSVTPVVVQ